MLDQNVIGSCASDHIEIFPLLFRLSGRTIFRARAGRRCSRRGTRVWRGIGRLILFRLVRRIDGLRHTGRGAADRRR